MYKRTIRTPRNIAPAPSPVRTSTSKYQAVNESERSRSMTQSQPSRVPLEKRKEDVDKIASKSLKRSKPAYASYFEEVVAEAGYIFQPGDNPHLLCMF
jgi:hypothetical protein